MAGEQFDLGKFATETAQNVVNGQIDGLRSKAEAFNLGNVWNDILKWINKVFVNNNWKLPGFLQLAEIETTTPPASAQASNEAAARAAASGVRNDNVRLADGTSPATTPAGAKPTRQVGA